MEGLMGTGAVILGVALRFGIPILFTALLVYLLRRLDERWQREAEQTVEAQPQELPLFSTLRCWITNDCMPDQKEKCPAFLEAVRPCWQVYRENGAVNERCLDCEVFKAAPIPVPA